MEKQEKNRGFKKGYQTVMGALLSIVAVNMMMPFIIERADPNVLERIDPDRHLDAYRIERVGYTEEERLEQMNIEIVEDAD